MSALAAPVEAVEAMVASEAMGVSVVVVGVAETVVVTMVTAVTAVAASLDEVRVAVGVRVESWVGVASTVLVAEVKVGWARVGESWAAVAVVLETLGVPTEEQMVEAGASMEDLYK